MRVEPAGAAFLVFHGLGGHHPLACAAPADAAHALLAAEHLLLDEQPLLAVAVDHQLWRAVAVGRIEIVLPQRERLQYVAVRIDRMVGASHRRPPPSVVDPILLEPGKAIALARHLEPAR